MPDPTRWPGRKIEPAPDPTASRVRVGPGRAYVKYRVFSGFGSKFLARARPVSHTGSKILTRARPSNSSGRVGSGYFWAGWVGSVGSGSPCPGLLLPAPLLPPSLSLPAALPATDRVRAAADRARAGRSSLGDPPARRAAPILPSVSRRGCRDIVAPPPQAASQPPRAISQPLHGVGLLGRITHRYVSNLKFPGPIQPNTPIRIGYVSPVYPRRIRIRYVSDTGYGGTPTYPCF